MNKPFCALVAVVAIGLGLSSTAFGVVDFFETRGTSCEPTVPSIAASLVYDRFGVGNGNNGGTKSVNCGATLPIGSISTVRVTVLDRHRVDNVACNMQLLNRSGVPLATASKSSVNGASEEQELTFALPVTVTGNINMTCNIPQIDTGVSYVVNYSLITDY